MFTTPPYSDIKEWGYVGTSNRVDNVHYWYGIAVTDELEMIKDFSKNEENLITKFNEITSKLQPGDKVDVVTVSRTTKVKITPLDADLVMEERRKVALGKLSPIEIEALGLETHAVYCKLKFHNAVKEND